MLGPTVALLVTQVVHGAVPVDENKPESESVLGFYVGILFLLLTVAALVGLVQRRPYGPRLAAWTGLAVAVGFVSYHAVPWSSAVSNPYLGEPVGAPAWLSVILAVGAGVWCAWTGREVLRRSREPGGRMTAPWRTRSWRAPTRASAATTTPIVTIEVERDVVRWHPLVRFFVCIPHLVWTGVLQLASVVVSFVIAAAVLVTGRVPVRLGAFQVLCLRERVRCYSYFFLLRRSAPRWPRGSRTTDPGDDPLVVVSATPPVVPIERRCSAGR